MIATPATILSFFTIFLLKNSALSGGVSVGGEGEGGDPSGIKDGGDPSSVKDGGNLSDIEWCEDSDPPDADEYGVDIDPAELQSVDSERCCEGVNLSGGE